jgi:hypothetical protein
MSTEELVIEKIRQLDSEQQQQVLAFIDALPKRQVSMNAEASPFGKRLRELRNEIIASGIPLLNDEELDREIAERRWGSYRKGNEFLIVRPDRFGIEKIVTYGVNLDDLQTN